MKNPTQKGNQVSHPLNNNYNLKNLTEQEISRKSSQGEFLSFQHYPSTLNNNFDEEGSFHTP